MRITIFLFLIVFFSFTSLAQADCVNPAGIEGEQVYNSTHKTMQFCDGTNWYSMKGGTVTTLDALSCSNGQVIKWNNGSSIWECANDDSGGAESDPQVSAVTSGKWCRGTGSAVTCDQDAPSGGSSGTIGGGCTGTSTNPWGNASCPTTCTSGVLGSCPSGYTAHAAAGPQGNSCGGGGAFTCGCGLSGTMHRPKFHSAPTFCIKN